MKSVSIDAVYCKGCELCIAVCKNKALTRGTTRNAKGYLTPHWTEDACVSCRNCELTCPELAITVEKEE
ncbi:MAG: 4Fe-4S binding protein [Desulfovibrio sp.]|jgi:2-oxoglutarate ferredoxin oxidoreductase subunit delta|nr:4Fe-4S binding protein [Desulfovibrio sp.]